MADGISKDDLAKELETHFGKVGALLADERRQTLEKVAALDAKFAALPTGGTAGKAKARYFRALADGSPVDVSPKDTVEDVIEREQERAAADYVRVAGLGNVPIIRTLPRGLQGVRDGRGLIAARIMQAAMVATLRDKAVTAENTLEEARRVFGAEDDACGFIEAARDLIAKRLKANATPEERAHAERALGTSILGSGAGFIVPEVWASFIDFLHPLSILRSLGVASIPLAAGMRFNFWDTAVQAGYVGEGQGRNEASPSEGEFQINKKIAQAIVALNNELLEDSSWQVAALIRDHMARSLAALSDLKFIEGRGTVYEPHGLDYWVEQPTTAHYANRTLDTGAVTYKTIKKDVHTALRVITDENMPMSASGGALPFVAMTNREQYGLMNVTVGTQEREPFGDEMRGGTFMGMRYGASTQTTKTLAGDASGHGTNNKSRVYIGNAVNLKIAEQDSINIEAFRGGAYKDASGNPAFGITNRQTVITGDMKHELLDFYRGKSIYRIDSVDWGVAF